MNDDRSVADLLAQQPTTHPRTVERGLANGEVERELANGEVERELANGEVERERELPLQRRRQHFGLRSERPDVRALELVEAIARYIRKKPLTSLFTVAGAGFLLGGALSFRAGRVLLAAGVRHVTRELMKQLL